MIAKTKNRSLDMVKIVRNRFSLVVILVFALLVSTAVGVTVSGDFSGNFSFVYYNSSLSGVVLNSSSFTGSYASSVYDSGSYARWSVDSNISDKYILVLVDNDEDIWKSVDSGFSWFTVNTSFSGDSDNSVDFVFFNDTMFLVDENEDVYSSSDFGHSFKLVYDDYNGGESGNGAVIGFDSSYFYIFESDEDVWRSSNLGLSWSKVNDSFTSKDIKGFVYDGSFIYVVDNGAEVWKSSDFGVSWTVTNSDYNLGDGDSADDFAYYSGNFFVLDGDSLWRSNDSGVNFVLVSSDFNVGDGSDGVSLTFNSDGLFVVDGSEDIYASYDLGSSWGLVDSNMNSGGSDVVSIISYDVSSINFSYYNGLVGVDVPFDGRYFSYVANFSRLDLDYSSVLHTSIIEYSVLNSAPNYTVNFDSSPTVSDVAVLNVSVFDYNGNSSFVTFYGDGLYLNYSYVINGSDAVYVWNASEGAHFWYAMVNDTNYVVSSNYSFSVDRSSPAILHSVSNYSFLSGENVFVNYSISDLNLEYVYFNVSLNGVLTEFSYLFNSTFNFSSAGNYTISIFANDSVGHFSYVFDSFFISDEVSGVSDVSGSGSSFGGGNRDSGVLRVLNETFSPNVLVGSDLFVETSSDIDELDFSADGVGDFEFNEDLDSQSDLFNRFTGAMVQVIGADESVYVLMVLGIVFVFSLGYRIGLSRGKTHGNINSKVKRKYVRKKKK